MSSSLEKDKNLCLGNFVSHKTDRNCGLEYEFLTKTKHGRVGLKKKFLKEFEVALIFAFIFGL